MTIEHGDLTQRFVREEDINKIISQAMAYNFEFRKDDAATYVAVDNTLRLMKHKIEDLFNA
tara:strand:- start:1250 stop:1432 length:183 start_codon:yes stop_codon:yes gene_type:complete